MAEGLKVHPADTGTENVPSGDIYGQILAFRGARYVSN
jgi:hypothetical protein